MEGMSRTQRYGDGKMTGLHARLGFNPENSKNVPGNRVIGLNAGIRASGKDKFPQDSFRRPGLTQSVGFHLAEAPFDPNEWM